MVSFTAPPSGSSSMVQTLGPSAASSGFHTFCQRMTMRRGGSISRISPASDVLPSGLTTSVPGSPAGVARWLEPRLPEVEAKDVLALVDLDPHRESQAMDALPVRPAD